MAWKRKSKAQWLKTLERERSEGYSDLSDDELSSQRKRLVDRHDELGKYYRESRSLDQEISALTKKATELRRTVSSSQAQRRGSTPFWRIIMGKMEAVTHAEQTMIDEANSIPARVERMQTRISEIAPLASERKLLYREIRAITSVMRKRTESRVRARAQAFSARSRSNSGSLRGAALEGGGDSNCPYCLSELDVCELDHIYPVAKGGLGTEENTVLVCSTCNQRKGCFTLGEFCDAWLIDYNEVRKRLKAMGKTV